MFWGRGGDEGLLSRMATLNDRRYLKSTTKQIHTSLQCTFRSSTPQIHCTSIAKNMTLTTKPLPSPLPYSLSWDWLDYAPCSWLAAIMSGSLWATFFISPFTEPGLFANAGFVLQHTYTGWTASRLWGDIHRILVTVDKLLRYKWN